MPLSDQAMLYKGTTTEAVKFTAAVDDLLADVLKKLNHSHQEEVNLDPPPCANGPTRKLVTISPCLVRHPANSGCLQTGPCQLIAGMQSSSPFRNQMCYLCRRMSASSGTSSTGGGHPTSLSIGSWWRPL